MACHLSAEEAKIKESASNSTESQTKVHLLSASQDYSAIERAEAPPSKKQRCCNYRQKGSLFEHLVYFCSLAVASYVGVMSRIFLSELARWNGVPYFPSLYPQLVGTAIMGFIVSHKTLLSPSFLYTAIATGLCGSITTFSSWNLEAVSTLLQIRQFPPNNESRVVGWATTLLLGMGMSSAALVLGQHIAALSPWADMKQQKKEVGKESFLCKYRCAEGCVFVFLWVVLTVIVVVLPYMLGKTDLVFSGVLASLGTYLRWHLSPLNSAFKHFKLGTFLVNVVGGWMLAGIVSLRAVYTEEGDLLHNLLTGMATGWCGCLTTVSTFAVELSSLPLGASYIYACTSIVLAQVGIILVRGTLQWTS